MKKQGWRVLLLVLNLMMALVQACGTDQRPSATLTRQPTTTPLATVGPTAFSPARDVATSTAAVAPPTPSATAPLTGPHLTDVQFALDVDQAGGLIFPATEFVFGVRRVYVRFAYQEMGDAQELISRWYLNDNPVSSSALAWDGGGEGEYVMWMEDPDGLGRGQWRWELMDGADVVGRGSFSVDGEPGYVNEIWGVTFEPPPGWELVSEQESFVTFSSPDQRRGLALRAILGVTDLSEIAAANLALFRADHPDAEVVATRETTMNGRGGLLQQVRAADPGAEDQESDEQLLFIASAIHGDAGYSLWVLGPADETEDLTRLLDTARLSVRFATD